jgi:hypothetical protein
MCCDAGLLFVICSCVHEKPELLICAIAIALATEAEGSVRATPDAPDADVVTAAQGS